MNYSTLGFIFLGCFLGTNLLSVFSQNNRHPRIISGKVIDVRTGEPIPMASVFIANTTIGTTTGEDGSYQLNIPGEGIYEFVISHVGYTTEVHQIPTERTLIRLDVELKTRELDEVVILPEARFNEKDISLFWKILLGVPPSPNSIYTTNREDVYYFYNQNTGILKASCKTPIRLVNMETGYRIHIILRTFEYSYRTDLASWEAYPFFEELNPKDNRQKRLWEINRKKVYDVSLIHFIRALHKETLLKEGFLLNYIRRDYNSSDSGIIVVKSLSPPINSRDLLFPNPIADGKIFRIHPDSTLLLTCFGKPVTDKEILQQKKYMMANGLLAKSKIHRNLISNETENVHTFPDGTYLNFLSIIPFSGSPTITGLNMMLPIEYGLDSDPTSPITDPSSNQITMPLIPEIDSLMQHQYPEKIYLATDRPFYAAGDTIWMSAWVLNSGTLEASGKSRMLHVELLRPDGSILRHLVLEASQGVAFGQFVLPSGIPGDDLFRLRAYTRWSLNFGESYRFEKIIPVAQFREDIWQGPETAATKNYEWTLRPNGTYAWKRKTDSEKHENIPDSAILNPPCSIPHFPPDLQFLPEGGRWVSGFPCRMAFKALAPDGRGVDVEGEIIDDTGVTVSTFQSAHQGMGSVFLAPQPGRSYQARLFSGHTVELPLPDTTGVVMSLQPDRNDSLELHLYFPPEIVQSGEMFYLVAQSRGMFANMWEIPANRTRVWKRIPHEGFQTGIVRFTLFNQHGIPCNERLVYIDKEDEIRLGTRLIKQDSSMMDLELTAQDMTGSPIQGVFTVSVTDSLYGSHDPKDAGLRSQMLLSSELSGKVENPGWYFQRTDSARTDALDLVMRTHGWSGYSWEDCSTTTLNQSYTPERDYQISGQVTNLRNKPVKDAPVSLWAEGAKTIINDTLTDEQGRFRFDHLLPWENTVALVKVTHKKGKKGALGLGIELDQQTGTPSPEAPALMTSSDKEDWEELLSLYRQQKHNDRHWLDSLLRSSENKYIEEVTIEAKRPVKGSYNLNGPGKADKVIHEEDIAKYDKYDRLLDIINAELPQIQQKSRREVLRSNHQLQDNLCSYPVWHFKNRPIAFILNGRTLPVDIPAEDNLMLPSCPSLDSLLSIADNFWNIPAKDIAGIELLDSPEYLWHYAKSPMYAPYLNCPTCNPPRTYDHPLRLLLIEVTTHSNRTNLEQLKVGTAKLRLQGFTIPKAFYVPGYYPENILDQAEYDTRPSLYWNPEVVTDKDGRAEIRFPTGLRSRGLQIRVEGTDLRGRIGSSSKGITTGKHYNQNNP